MRRALYLILGIVGALAAQQSAAARSPNSLPLELRRYIVELNNSCKEAGGAPGKSSNLVKFADLTGDAVVDYVVDVSAYECGGAASALSAGQSGAAVAVFVGGPNNTAVKAYDNTVYGVNIDESGPKPRLYIDVAALDCGQKNAAKLPFSSWKFCSRPLDWNAAKNTFVFAPLAEARPVR
ncbi:hypothetical protein Msil_0238 [Methylocella silvestris BL2]|uniref:Uncharacterized protein n=1 Tax=Methylocella silvestris (strain DSM 15510 / CIP 108128 / LMG 27833 / NCIMB 13906 / BL2) TaxID=395965 RepID=B8ENY0_METSB|nr:hypothetical protein [Methylocella silvestris]ACK49218.1 hypothetical protein Msil_0238 [Methylocella silvestris BL2]